MMDGTGKTQGEMRNAYKILVADPEKETIGRSGRHGSEDIEMDLKQMEGWGEI
jgi:hypothetical protein